VGTNNPLETKIKPVSSKLSGFFYALNFYVYTLTALPDNLKNNKWLLTRSAINLDPRQPKPLINQTKSK
jgi:hypothetical protein